jgi:hypothetical protein
MSDENLKSDAIRAEANLIAERHVQARRLEAYPLLVVAPLQESHAHPAFGREDQVDHGPMLRTEDRGVPVADIAAAAGTTPDPGALAERFGTTAEHVRQALAYVAEHGPDA